VDGGRWTDYGQRTAGRKDAGTLGRWDAGTLGRWDLGTKGRRENASQTEDNSTRDDGNGFAQFPGLFLDG
jgi:hypothetical protein